VLIGGRVPSTIQVLEAKLPRDLPGRPGQATIGLLGISAAMGAQLVRRISSTATSLDGRPAPESQESGIGWSSSDGAAAGSGDAEAPAAPWADLRQCLNAMRNVSDELHIRGAYFFAAGVRATAAI
jgi:hypothetical protein